jgi:hypothetical protein
MVFRKVSFLCCNICNFIFVSFFHFCTNQIKNENKIIILICLFCVTTTFAQDSIIPFQSWVQYGGNIYSIFSYKVLRSIEKKGCQIELNCCIGKRLITTYRYSSFSELPSDENLIQLNLFNNLPINSVIDYHANTFL